MAINFPNSPTANDQHTAGGVTWTWDGTTWKSDGATASYTLPIATSNALGGIKVGANLSINSTSGILSADASAITVQEEGTSLNIAATTLNFVGAGVTASGTTATKTITIPGGGAGEPTITWTLGANGSTDYTFTGSGFTSATNDPTLYLIRGQTYKFDNQTGGHPFRIQSTVAQAGGGTAYNSGVTNNDATGGTATNVLTFVVPMDAPDTLYYQCTAHPAMTGTINVITQGSSGLQSRTTSNGTTASVANGTAADLTITAAKTYVLHEIETDKAAWVTLYTDTASRTADANRTEIEDPIAGSGVVAEVVTTQAWSQKLTPGTIGYNLDSTPSTNVYLKVVNKSGSTGTVQVTLKYLALEV